MSGSNKWACRTCGTSFGSLLFALLHRIRWSRAEIVPINREGDEE